MWIWTLPSGCSTHAERTTGVSPNYWHVLSASGLRTRFEAVNITVTLSWWVPKTYGHPPSRITQQRRCISPMGLHRCEQAKSSNPINFMPGHVRTGWEMAGHSVLPLENSYFMPCIGFSGQHQEICVATRADSGVLGFPRQLHDDGTQFADGDGHKIKRMCQELLATTTTVRQLARFLRVLDSIRISATYWLPTGCTCGF